MIMIRYAACLFIVGVTVLAVDIAFGQTYPNKPIRVITAGAGGGTDFQARLLAQGISGSLGQQVIIENRSAIFYQTLLLRALPDGYTLLVGGEGVWIAPLLQKTDYDPVRDFGPISLIARTSNILVVHPSVPVKSVKELIDLAKAKPAWIKSEMARWGKVIKDAGIKLD